MPPPKLERLAGSATTQGPSYEFKMAALVALRARRRGLRFQLFSNVKAARPWDDLVLRVEGQQPVTYFIQLKHGKKGGRVTSQAFQSAGKNDFSLRKYFEEFRLKQKQREELMPDERILCDWMLEDFRFAIYTNRKAEQPTPPPDARDELDFPLDNLLETGDRNNTFCFHDGDEMWKLVDDEEYREEFLPRLRVFGRQAHVNALDDLMVQELNSMFTKPLPRAKEYVISYVERFKKWAESPEGRAVTLSSGELEEALAHVLRRRARSAAGDGVLAFQEDHCTALRETLVQFDSVLVEVHGVPCGHRVAKVQQVLDRDFPGRWAYVDDRIVRELPPDALLAACGACDVVVVDVDRAPKQVQDFVREVDKNSKLKLVVLSADCGKDVHTLRRIVSFQKIKEEDWRLEHLLPEAQERMMAKTLNFQGDPISLGELQPTWPELRGDVDGPLLSALARGVAALGEAPSEDDDTPHHISRTLTHTHTSVLHRDVLRLADDPSEHLVLWGFSREELDEENSRAKGDDHKAWNVPESKTKRWTILSNEEEYTDINVMRQFKMLSLLNHGRNVHLVQNVKGTVLWQATEGNPDAITKYVIPRNKSCNKPYNPNCVHEISAEESAVAWTDRVNLLLGQPGIGKSSFMCSLAVQQHERAPETWAIVMKLLEHLELLEDMPDPGDMNKSNVACVLAAAAGVAAPVSSAARRCLEAALFRSDSVHIFMDGMDEVMPAYKDKALRLLDLILKETRAARVWVASRPEVDNSLRRILSCTPVSLLPLSPAEQVTYLRKSWTFAGLGYTEDAMERLAKEVVDAFAPNPRKEKGNAEHDISDYSGHSLLAVPLNLKMTAEALVDDARIALETKGSLLQNRVSQLDLFRRFVDNNLKRCRERYGIKTPAAIITNLFSDEEDVFVPVHQSCAMLIWTAASIPYCQHKFQESVKRSQKYLPGEKSGILWQREDGKLQFSHYMFVEYFVATWLFKKRKKSRKNEKILEAAVRGKGKVMFFLDLMLAEECPLHKAIIEDNRDILDAPLPREKEIDLGGRSALHLAAAYGRTDAVDKFLKAGYDVSQCDSLLQWTPLLYADATLELEAIEKLLNSKADTGQLMNTKLATQMDPLLILRAVQLDLLEVTRIMVEVRPVPTVSLQLPTEFIFKWTLLHCAAQRGSTSVAQHLIGKGINVNCQDALGNTPLHQAVAEGHKDMVKLLLSRGADVEIITVDTLQNTPLYLAVGKGHVELVQLLVENGANINRKTVQENTPMHIAALKGDEEMTEVLLSLGAGIHYPGQENRTPLHYASMMGHANVVKRLLSREADVSLRDIEGRTAIHHAASRGHMHVMKMFFEKLAPDILQREINSSDEHQCSPLYLAASNKHNEMVQLLIKHGANIGLKSGEGYTPMHIAALNGDEKTTEVLLSQGADIHCLAPLNGTPLHCASQVGHVNVVKQLLSRGADVSRRDIFGRNAIHIVASRGHMNLMNIFFEELTPSILQREINSTDEHQYSPLHMAADNKHKEMVKLLIEHGASISPKTVEGYMPMHIAALKGDEETTEVLLSMGADIHCCGEHNATPLHYALRKGHANVVKLLLSHGADVSRRDIYGRTAMHYAASSGHTNVMKMIFEELTPSILQEEINAVDVQQFSPIYMAAADGHKEMAQLLIEHGANISIKQDEGHMPIHIAALNGHEETTEFLLSLGVDIHCRGQNKVTPLHYASQGGHVNVVKLLLSRGADVSMRDVSGRTAIHHAASKGHINVMKMFFEEFAPSILQREINSSDDQQASPLHMAATKGHKEMVQLLIEHGANISLKTEEGHMPMHIAALNGHEGTTEVLLSLGADIYCRGKNDATPLHCASLKGHANVLRRLLSRGADVSMRLIDGATAIHIAAYEGHREVVEVLLHAGGEVESCDSFQCTPLLLAAGRGHVEVVQFLLSKGADVNRNTCHGVTAVQTASLHGHLGVVQVLLNEGADVNMWDANEQSPLHLAALKGHADIVRQLLSHGADAHKMDKRGLVPMQFALSNHHNDVAIILLRESFGRALSGV